MNASEIVFKVEWTSPKQKSSNEVEVKLQVPNRNKDDTSGSSDVTPASLHIQTHYIRVKCALLMQKVLHSTHTLRAEIESIHDWILSLLSVVQQREYEGVVLDEGILVSLENNIGQVLEVFEDHNRLQHFKSRFLQFALEHLLQKSSTSATQFAAMSPYSTLSQLRMRLKFLSATNKSGEKQSDKIDLPLDYNGDQQTSSLTAQQLAKRAELDTIHCYISLENWRTCHLGIGLLVRPRTARERYKKLVPTVCIVEDYVSAEAFNQGVRGSVTDTSKMLTANIDEGKKFGLFDCFANQDIYSIHKQHSGIMHKPFCFSLKNRRNF